MHEPGQHGGGDRPDHREAERPGGQHAADDVVGGHGQRAVEVRAGGRARGRAEHQHPLQQRLAEQQPPRAERAERGAGADPRAARGEHRVDGRQAREAQRGCGGGERPRAAVGRQERGRERDQGEHDERGAGPRIVAKASRVAVSRPAASQPARGKSATSTTATAAATPGVSGGCGVSPATARPTRAPAAPGASSRPSAGGRAGSERSSGSAAIVPPSSDDLGQRVGQGVEEIVERAALVRVGQDRAVDRGAQRGRQVGAAAAERDEHAADAPRGRAGRARLDGVHAGQPLVEHDAERVQVRALVHRPALGLLGGHVGERADDVARSSSAGPRPPGARRRSPSASPLRAARGPARGTRTFCGLTSRCTTPRSCAWPSASASASPARSTSRSDSSPVGLQLRERAALTSSETR